MQHNNSQFLKAILPVFVVVVLLLCPTLLQPHGLQPAALLSMGFPRQEYWSGLPFPSPGDLPNPGIKPTSPVWQADSLPLGHLGRPYSLYSYYKILTTVPMLYNISL